MNLSPIAKKMLLITCAALPLLAAGGFAYFRSARCLPFICGTLAGTALNAAKILLLDRATRKIAGGDEKSKAAGIVYLHQFLRFALTGLVLVGAALLSPLMLYGAAAAVLVYPIAVYSMKFSIGGR